MFMNLVVEIMSGERPFESQLFNEPLSEISEKITQSHTDFRDLLQIGAFLVVKVFDGQNHRPLRLEIWFTMSNHI